MADCKERVVELDLRVFPNPGAPMPLLAQGSRDSVLVFWAQTDPGGEPKTGVVEMSMCLVSQSMSEQVWVCLRVDWWPWKDVPLGSVCGRVRYRRAAVHRAHGACAFAQDCGQRRIIPPRQTKAR